MALSITTKVLVFRSLKNAARKVMFALEQGAKTQEGVEV
jgi:hypothetical protein